MRSLVVNFDRMFNLKCNETICSNNYFAIFTEKHTHLKMYNLKKKMYKTNHKI